jgi:hypothetical protein
VTIKVIRGGRFDVTKQANVRRLLLVVRAPEMLHEMRLLPEPVQAQDAFIRPHARMRPEVDIHIGLRTEDNPAHRTFGFFPQDPAILGLHGIDGHHQVTMGHVIVVVIVIILLQVVQELLPA